MIIVKKEKPLYCPSDYCWYGVFVMVYKNKTYRMVYEAWTWVNAKTGIEYHTAEPSCRLAPCGNAYSEIVRDILTESYARVGDMNETRQSIIDELTRFATPFLEAAYNEQRRKAGVL